MVFCNTIPIYTSCTRLPTLYQTGEELSDSPQPCGTTVEFHPLCLQATLMEQIGCMVAAFGRQRTEAVSGAVTAMREDLAGSSATTSSRFGELSVMTAAAHASLQVILHCDEIHFICDDVICFLGTRFVLWLGSAVAMPTHNALFSQILMTYWRDNAVVLSVQ